MKKKDIRKKKNCVLFFAILTSVALPAGIVATVLGATCDKTAVMIIGLVALVLSFFALPFVWLFFASMNFKAKLVFVIEKKAITDVINLAEIFNKHAEEITRVLNELITSGFINPNLFYKIKESEKLSELKCFNCGAKLIETEDKFVCNYCKSEFKK